MDGLNNVVILAIKEYIDEVKSKVFPDKNYTYSIKDEALRDLQISEFWKN